MGWFWSKWKQKYLEMRDKRDIALDERNEAREQRNAAEVQVKLRTKERDEAQAAKDELYRDAAARYDQIKGERDEARTERDEARADVERLNEKVEVTNKANATERRKLIAERDNALARNKEVMADADGLKDDLVQAEFDRDAAREQRDNFKAVISEKDDEIEMLSEQLATAEAQQNDRPVIEVELYDSKTGRKATPCKRFVGRHEGAVVAVSPPQGTPDEQHARERIALLSAARWVIISRKAGSDGNA